MNRHGSLEKRVCLPPSASAMHTPSHLTWPVDLPWVCLAIYMASLADQPLLIHVTLVCSLLPSPSTVHAWRHIYLVHYQLLPGPMHWEDIIPSTHTQRKTKSGQPTWTIAGVARWSHVQAQPCDSKSLPPNARDSQPWRESSEQTHPTLIVKTPCSRAKDLCHAVVMSASISDEASCSCEVPNDVFSRALTRSRFGAQRLDVDVDRIQLLAAAHCDHMRWRHRDRAGSRERRGSCSDQIASAGPVRNRLYVERKSESEEEPGLK